MSRLLILSAGAILALTSVASAAPAMQPLKISKECSQYTGDTPSFCTITESNLAAIPAGTKIFYYGPVTGSPLFGSSTAVIAVGNGDLAVGYCVDLRHGQPAARNLCVPCRQRDARRIPGGRQGHGRREVPTALGA